jgi:hypothetical protein
MAQNIIQVIEATGNDKVCSVIRDSSGSMKAALRIITKKYHHINTLGCAAHASNFCVRT